jgi:antirestriction protein ArdC
MSLEIDGRVIATPEFREHAAAEATRVAGYRTWQALGRQVRRGEHGIAVLAPVTYRTQESATGTTDTTEPDECARQLRGFKFEHVFDISQTDGEELPDVAPVALIGESPAGLWDAIVAQIEAEGFTACRGVCANSGANGETSWSTPTVTVRDDLEPAQACRTLVHERAHIVLRHGDELRSSGCRGRVEVEAESVAFMVSTEASMLRHWTVL